MAWGKSKEIEEMERLIDIYEKAGETRLAQELKVELAATENAVKAGYLETASGRHLPQAKARKVGQRIVPMNIAQLNKMHTTNPMSLGGATFAPVNQKVLFPWREEEDIEKRSPYWSLFGYS